MDDFLKQYHPPGTAPGTLQRAIEPESRLSQRSHLLDYTESGLEERELADPRDCLAYLAQPSHTWIHLGPTPDPETPGHFGELFGLHPLGLEDVVNVGQRPKVDTFEDHLLVILNRPVRAEGEPGFSRSASS